MLTRALTATRNSRQDLEKATPATTHQALRRRPQQACKRDYIAPASTKIGKYISHALTLPMRAKHHAEIGLTINRNHFSGLTEVLPQLDAFKYKTPPMTPDPIDGALLDVPANLEIASQHLRALVKDDNTRMHPLAYLKTDSERAPYGISIGADNTLRWTATRELVGEGEYIFVWGPDEKLYAAQEKVPGRAREFRHSTFFAGAAVLFAGEIEVGGAGYLVTLNNKSGHYRPEFQPWVTFLSFLGAQGFDVQRVRKTFITKSKRQAIYMRWMQLNGSDTGQVDKVVKQRK